MNNLTISGIYPSYFKVSNKEPLKPQKQNISFQKGATVLNPFYSGQINTIKAPVVQRIKNETRYFNSFISKPGRLTKQEYENIIKNHPTCLLKAERFVSSEYKGSLKPKDIARIAVLVDKYLKDKNYRIISVGTSPALLCEMLKFLGHDVVFLPLSSLRAHNLSQLNPEEMKNLNLAMEYLREKGVENDGKINMVLDLSDTGATLENTTAAIKKFLDIPNESIEKQSLQELVNSAYNAQEKQRFGDFWSINAFSNDVELSYIEAAVNVPHFDIMNANRSEHDDFNTVFAQNKTKQEVFEEFDKYSDPLARCFTLAAFHEIDLAQK